MFGRQPVSPIDAVAVVTKSQWSKTVNYPEHVKRAEKISAELKALAGDNDRIAKQVRNRYHNTGVGAPQFKKGDLVLEKNETRKDSLDRKFHGPYRVIDVWDTSVKIQKGRKRKWIHASRCKCFPESRSAIDTTELKPDLPVTGKPPPERAGSGIKSRHNPGGSLKHPERTERGARRGGGRGKPAKREPKHKSTSRRRRPD